MVGHQFFVELDAPAAGQVQIGQDEPNAVLGQASPGLLGVGGFNRLVTCVLQEEADASPQVLFVFHDQHSRGSRARGIGLRQHLCHFLGQGVDRERFLDKGRSGGEHFLVDDGAVGVARHEEHAHVGPMRGQDFRQLAAAHLGHHDVGQ
jgi:hypothetical protein